MTRSHHTSSHPSGPPAYFLLILDPVDDILVSIIILSNYVELIPAGCQSPFSAQSGVGSGQRRQAAPCLLQCSPNTLPLRLCCMGLLSSWLHLVMALPVMISEEAETTGQTSDFLKKRIEQFSFS